MSSKTEYVHPDSRTLYYPPQPLGHRHQTRTPSRPNPFDVDQKAIIPTAAVVTQGRSDRYAPLPHSLANTTSPTCHPALNPQRSAPRLLAGHSERSHYRAPDPGQYAGTVVA